MPSGMFDIESYTLLTTQNGVSSSGAFRLVGLTGPALAHGIRTYASIYFFENPGSVLGIVNNVDQPNFNGRRAFAYLRKADFADWYDILRNEKPLKCYYSYAGADFDPNESVRSLLSISLSTGEPEPPGEGPEEVQAQQFPAEMLRIIRDRVERKRVSDT
jgi:hypothetical protein